MLRETRLRECLRCITYLFKGRKKPKGKELIKAVMKKNYIAEDLVASEFASSCVVLLNVHEPVGRQTSALRMSNVRNRRSKINHYVFKIGDVFAFTHCFLNPFLQV